MFLKTELRGISMGLNDKIKEARESLKLSQDAVSVQTHIGVSSLSEFENGKREPRLSQLASLARVYKKPVTFFLEDETPSQETVLWRERPSQNAEVIEHDFLELCRRYSNLERWCNDVISPELPHVNPSQSSFSFFRAEEVAQKVRKELNLGDRPSFSLLQVLEDKCGVKIFHQEIEPTGTAASVKSARYGWAILLNSKNSQERRNFDLAHELFHLLTWEVFGHHLEGQLGLPNAEEESFANAFASYLLMPEEEMRSAVEKRRRDGKLSLAAIGEIAHQFQVSAEAVLWRVHRLYGLDREKTNTAIKQIRERHSYGQAQSEVGDELLRLPGRYQDLAYRALQQGELSIKKFAEYMNISTQAAMRYNEENCLDAEITLTAG